MKKIRAFFVCLFVAALVSVSAVEVKDGYLYGNLSIAYNNELPSGLFAKSRNYLPGDTLHISNPFTGEEINVLNLSTLDEGSESILMLTTEAANRLGIDFKDSLYVRVSPRTSDFDEIAAGSAMLTRNKNAVQQLEEPAVAQTPKTTDLPPVPPAEEPEKVQEIATASEPEKDGEAVSRSDVSDPKPEAIALPKLEPVADLSTLAEEPPLAQVVPEEVRPLATEKAAVANSGKEEDILSALSDQVEEAAVRPGEGGKSSAAAIAVSGGGTTQPLALSEVAGGVEEVAVRQQEEKLQSTSTRPQLVYEQALPRLQLSDESDAEAEAEAVEEGVRVAYRSESEASVPYAEDEAVVAEMSVSAELETKHAAIFEITEESVKLASNGLVELPSARMSIEERPASSLPQNSAVDAAVYEYPQTLSAVSPASAFAEEVPVVSDPLGPESWEPASVQMDLVDELPVPALFVSPTVPAVSPVVSEADASPEPVLESAYIAWKRPAAAELEPVGLSESPAPAAEIAALPFVSDMPAADVDSSWAAVEPAPVLAGRTEAEALEEEGERNLPPVPPLAQNTSLSQTEPQKLAPETKPSTPPVVAERPRTADLVQKAESKKSGATKKSETTKNIEAPKKVEAPNAETAKKNVSPKKTEAPKPVETEKKSATPKKESPAQLVAKKENKPLVRKEVKAPDQAEDSSDSEEELVYSHSDELKLVPGSGGPQAYSGEAAEKKEKVKPQHAVSSADSDDDDSDDIIVNKQDVFTLNPADSVSPSGKVGEGQKAYTPQNPAPKATSSSTPATDKTSADNASGSSSADTQSASTLVATAVQEKDLKAGNYVQFATCTTDAEAEKIIGKYKKYPIIRVLFEKRPGYKLLVGPLGDDEKGAVLTRFRAFGFTDAYLRKIQ